MPIASGCVPRGCGRSRSGVPDVRSPRFASEARRQSLLANTGPLEAEDQAFVDAISLWPDQAQE